jgi:hypothetical protein
MALGLLLLAVVAFLSVMVLKSVWYQKKLSGKLPPGPAPLPFIGNYLQLKTEFYTSIIKVSMDRKWRGDGFAWGLQNLSGDLWKDIDQDNTES